jgi:diacylglycerol kinase (ATP)
LYGIFVSSPIFRQDHERKLTQVGPQHLTIFCAQIDRLARLRQHNGLVELPPGANPSEPDLLLVNPSAGGGRAARALSELRAFAAAHGWNVEFRATQSADDLAAEARDAAETGRRRILVLGGDGTFQLLVNAVGCNRRIIVGVIPAGGGNDLAASLGLPSHPLQAAALLLKGETCELDVARVRSADGKERLYTGGGGVGLDSEAAKYANGACRNLPGRFRYLAAAIRALFGFRAIGVQVTFCERETTRILKAKALLVGVLNTPSYGGGLFLAPEAKTGDGNLDLVLLEDLSVARILVLLPSLALTGQLRTQKLSRFPTTHIRIETDPPSWFHGDGEFLGMTPVEVSVVPRAIRVLRPAQSKDS